MLQIGDKVGIVCCSNGIKEEFRGKLIALDELLREIGLCPVWSEHIYGKDNAFSGTAKERAESLMNFYQDEKIKVIFDISGGDIANEVLPYLDFDIIANTDKEFWGYSDLTTIINAIYSKTRKTSVLYQVRNLIDQEVQNRLWEFEQDVFMKIKRETFECFDVKEREGLFDFSYRFARGTELDGIVVGGNIRCLLKLAGTEYFPDMTDKILLLEAMSGEVPQMVTYLNQLQQMGVFHKVKGILLGTFTRYEENPANPLIEELVMRYLPENLPVVKTDQLGHGIDSKAIRIGSRLYLLK